MKKMNLFILAASLASTFLAGCDNKSPHEDKPIDPIPDKHWTHYAQMLPGEISGETNGVREYYVDDNGNYQFNKPAGTNIDYGTDVDFTTFSSNDPRYIIPITEKENNFSCALVDLSDSNKLYLDEVDFYLNGYTNAETLPTKAGVKTKVLYMHSVSSNTKPYYYVDTIACTKIFTDWNNLQTVFGGSATGNPDFVNLDKNIYIDGYYAMLNDIEINDRVEFSGIDCISEKDKVLDRGFRGVFDGRSHKITEKNGSYSGGLFGSLLGGTIKNLTIDNIELKADQLGALACQSHNATVENVTLNYKSIKKTDCATGIIIGKFISNTYFNNVTINASDLNIESVFGGFYSSNIFNNFTLNAVDVISWGFSDFNSKKIKQPAGITAKLSSTKIYIDLPVQDIVLNSSSIQSINLGKAYSSVNLCDSITLFIKDKNYSLGQNVKSLVIPEELKKTSLYGDASLEVRDGANVYVVNVFIATDYVDTLEDLEKLAAYETNVAPINGYYILNKDIDFGTFSKQTYANWGFENGFQGILDGRNHKMSIDLSNAKNGLFGVMTDATIKDITIESTNYSSGTCLIAYYMNNCQFSNVSLTISDSITDVSGETKYIISNGGSLNNNFNNFRFSCSFDVECLFYNYYDTDQFNNCTIILPSLEMFSSNSGSISRKNPPTGCTLIETTVHSNTLWIEKTESSFTLPIVIDGTIKSVMYNSVEISKSLTIKTDIFDGIFGDAGNIVIFYEKENILFKCIAPITVVTKALKNVTDVKNYLSIADAEVGAIGDGYYGGYFVLANDIEWDGTNFVQDMPEIPHDINQVGKGFNGVFDGMGHSLINFRTSNSSEYCALVPRLGKNGVLKNIGFVDFSYTNCAIAAAWGEGLVENIYVSYKNGITHYNTFAVTNVYPSSWCNVVLKDSLVDARNDKSDSPRALGNSYKVDQLYYNNVFVLTKTNSTPVVEINGDAERNISGYVKRTYPLSYNTYSSYTNYADLLSYGGDEIGSWNYFSFKDNELKFGDNVLSNVTPSELPETHKFIDDYVIIYDKNNLDSIKAAYLIELELLKSSATSLTYTELNGKENNQMNITGGLNIRKLANAKYSDKANLIVVGNNDVAKQAEISVETNRIVSKSNSIFILSKNPYDCMAAGYEFLKEVIGCHVLGQDFIIFDTLPSKLPEIDIEFTVAAPYRLLSNKLTTYFYEQMAINLAYSSYCFDDGPHVDGDPSKEKEQIHNDMDWLPATKYQTVHPKWYRSWNNLDLCWTAHGDANEYQLLVDTLAQNMYEVLAANTDAKRLCFAMEDINYTHCECDACCAVESANGTYAYQGIKLLNDVTSKIEKMDGMVGREFYVYLLAYYFTTKAPSNIKLGEHVGVLYAPARYDYGKAKSSKDSAGQNPVKMEETKLIYDPDSTGNKFVRENFKKWQNLLLEKSTGKNEMGCWFYDVYWNNYLSFMDTYEYNISLCEFIAHEGKGNLRFVYIQGQNRVVNGTGFEAFKQFVNSRALIEAGNKVKNYSECYSHYQYQLSVSKYLRDLENEFFGISSRKEDIRYVPKTSGSYNDDVKPYRDDCTFNDKGYYGNAGANNSMYTLYIFQRNEHAWAIANGKLTGTLEERYYLETSVNNAFSYSSDLDLTRYITGQSGSLSYYYRFKQVRISIVASMLNCYFEALNRINDFNGAYKNMCIKHINFEGLMPLFLASMANSSNSACGFGAGFTYNGKTYSFTELRTMFKTIAQSQAITILNSTIKLDQLYSKFGF